MLGLTLGLLLGLSASPVLGAALTGAFALATVALQEFRKDKKQTTFFPTWFTSGTTEPADTRVGANESSSVITPNTHPPFTLLFPLTLMVFCGVIMGIFMRVNDVLDFRSKDIRRHLIDMGFGKDQAQKILDHQWQALVEEPRHLPRYLEKVGFSDHQIQSVLERAVKSSPISVDLKQTLRLEPEKEEKKPKTEQPDTHKTEAYSGDNLNWLGDLKVIIKEPLSSESREKLAAVVSRATTVHEQLDNFIASHADDLVARKARTSLLQAESSLLQSLILSEATTLKDAWADCLSAIKELEDALPKALKRLPSDVTPERTP